MLGERVFVGVGSNLADPVLQVREGISAIASLGSTRVVGCSSLYRNPAIGPGSQPDYVNAVVEIETTLEPPALLAALHAIEASRGRTRGPLRWAPRTLDLDLIAFGDRRASDEALTLPHPRAHERAFVLVPLAEIAPGARLPGHGAAAALAARLETKDLERIEGTAEMEDGA